MCVVAAMLDSVLALVIEARLAVRDSAAVTFDTAMERSHANYLKQYIQRAAQQVTRHSPFRKGPLWSFRPTRISPQLSAAEKTLGQTEWLKNFRSPCAGQSRG